MAQKAEEAFRGALRVSEGLLSTAKTYRGGFWAKIGFSCALGAVLTGLAMAAIFYRGDAERFGELMRGSTPETWCGVAGGESGRTDAGAPYCVFWTWRR